MKKKLLIIYPYMMLGGSTTSLISLLKNLNFDEFDVELQLFQNNGELIDYIPENVKLLPPAKKHKSNIAKYFDFLISGYIFKAFFSKHKRKKLAFASAVKGEFMAKRGSRKNKSHYDYAIGFLEGWSNRYLAYGVNADKKYAWLHSTFANITKTPKAELPWMEKVDKIVFVTDVCTEEFKKTLPEMADKAITIENITDSSLVRQRSEEIPENDEAYIKFASSKKTKIVTVCRIDIKTKGLDRIINSAKKLKDSGHSFIWYIIGSGQDTEALLDKINENGLCDFVFAIGIRMNPYPFIREADIMCMPSRYEGKPMVITESMILGTAPVVTKYLSAEDQIKNGLEGIIVENTDDSITAPLVDLITNPEKIEVFNKFLLSNNYGNNDYINIIEKTLF